MMLQGMTAQFLVKRTYPVKQGDTILVHAAAGGVGSIVMPMGQAPRRHRHRRGLDPGEGRADQELGADHALLTSENIPARVKEITRGAMLPVVYDSVGKDTFITSLDCLVRSA